VLFKLAFKKERKKGSRTRIPHAVDYSLPSTHSMFYFGYFFETGTWYSLAMALICPALRIVNSHHSMFEIFCSLAISCVVHALFKRLDPSVSAAERLLISFVMKSSSTTTKCAEDY